MDSEGHPDCRRSWPTTISNRTRCSLCAGASLYPRLTIVVNFSRRGAGVLGLRGQQRAVAMRIANERTFSTLSRRLWRLRFLRVAAQAALQIG